LAIDRKAAERAISDFLRALGHDPARDPELAETPARATDAFAIELLGGYDIDVRALIEGGSSPLAARSESAGHGIVAIRDIAVATVCPHHLLPALGSATVAYRPGKLLLGLGVIAHVVDAYARRLTMQEAIGERVVEALLEIAGARGAYCALDLTHSCLSARGARQDTAIVRTVATGGDLAGPEAVPELSLALARDDVARSPKP
jgi:GTP cyclohydrolase IA